MKKQKPPFQKYILVCEHVRENGEACCGPKVKAHGYIEKLKECVKKAGLKGKVRVSRTGCLDVCAQGPNIIVYEGGEGRWYSEVEEGDLEAFVKKEITTE